MPFVNSVRGTFGPNGRFGAAANIVASGGTVTTFSGYKIHTFNNSGTFTLSSAPSGPTFDFLMIAGGGGGGTGNGNNSAHPGGGAGGLIYRTAQSLTAGSYSIVVGDGGAGAPGSGSTSSTPIYATSGVNTTFNGLTALGGGGAPSYNSGALIGQNGGSGSGGQHATNSNRIGGNALQPGSASGGFGFKGGDGQDDNTLGGPCWTGGGGGGAGAAGVNGTPNIGGEGGIGKQYDISGISRYYAGGGGGGTTKNNSNTDCLYNPLGGLGGGGTGWGKFGPGDTGRHGGDAFGNFGGGGGGATSGTDTFVGGTPPMRGGNGGKGTVIIRYPSSSSLSAPQNVPGLTVWLDASSSSNFTLSGSNITAWNDKSGNGYNCSGTGNPQFISNVKNGFGVARFAGTSYLQNTDLPYLKERTVFIVRRWNSFTVANNIFGFPTRIPTTQAGIWAGSATQVGFNSWNGDVYGVSNLPFNSWGVDTLDFKSDATTTTSNAWRLNGVALSLSQILSSPGNRQQFANGYNVARGAATDSQFFLGDIGEILIFDSVLSTANQQVIETYLQSKWGIA